MQIGEVGETITVESTASSLQTETSAVNTTLTTRAKLPLNGRNLINLVSSSWSKRGQSPQMRRAVSALRIAVRHRRYRQRQSEQTKSATHRTRHLHSRVEGESGCVPRLTRSRDPSPDKRVTAEVGRTGGGVIMSSRNRAQYNPRFSLFEFFRNNIFDANPFAFGAHLPQAELRQNQFGGSIGGPIRRDKLLRSPIMRSCDKIQGTTPTSLTVPTLYEEQHPGDFSDTGGAVLPANTIDPAGLAYFSLLPAPNNGATTYTGVGQGTYYSRTIDGRVRTIR